MELHTQLLTIPQLLRYTEAELEKGNSKISRFRPENAAPRRDIRQSDDTHNTNEAMHRGINIAAPPASDLNRISKQGPPVRKHLLCGGIHGFPSQAPCQDASGTTR
jgi:hypothetical protein